MTKEKILQMLNHALELEYAAYAQYIRHAKLVSGANSAKIIERLDEIAGDEKKHQEKFQNLILILGGIPTTKSAPIHSAKSISEILETNRKDEKVAVDTYRKILDALRKEKGQGYYDHLLEHEVRHILMEEQEHITELELLLGNQGSSY